MIPRECDEAGSAEQLCPRRTLYDLGLSIAEITSEERSDAAAAGAALAVALCKNGIEQIVARGQLAVGIKPIVQVDGDDVVALQQGNADAGHAALNGLAHGLFVCGELLAVVGAALRSEALAAVGVVRHFTWLWLAIALLKLPAQEDRQVAQGRRYVDV